MKQQSWLVLLICIAMMLSIACDDDAATTNSGKVLDQFPNTIGDTWTYEVYETAEAQRDTVDVQVVSIGTSPEGEGARIWLASYRHRVDTAGMPLIDTMWVVEAEDMVKVYRSRAPGVMSFVLPFEVDNSWTTPGHSDTTIVSGKVSFISYPGGLLPEGYLLERDWNEVGVGNEHSSIVVVPDVGIVSMNLFAVSFVVPRGTTMDNWRILSFDLQ